MVLAVRLAVRQVLAVKEGKLAQEEQMEVMVLPERMVAGPQSVITHTAQFALCGPVTRAVIHQQIQAIYKE
jgi:hypothetical protein